jgi:hypothetical protein
MTGKPFHGQWIPAVVLGAAVALAGCPRVLYLDYRPATSVRGSGPVRVDAFTYAGHPRGLMQQKELETGARDVEALYLSQDIGEFFAAALKKELDFAGYELKPDAPSIISGTIDQFSLNYEGQENQRFQMQATFQVTRQGIPPSTGSCHSDKRQRRDWMRSGMLIEQGVKDCLDEFLRGAQAAGAL